MFKKGLALAGVLASTLMLQMSGCVVSDPQPDDSTASESEAVIIDTNDIKALAPGEHITVDLTAADARYQIEFSSLADLDAIHVITSDGEHVLGESVEFDGQWEAGTLTLSPTDAKMLPPQEDQAVCVLVCCYHLICFKEK